MICRLVKHLYCLLTIIIVCNANGKAQDSLHRVVMPVFVHGTFFYDFPQSFGLASGVDFPLKSNLKTTIDKNGKGVIRHQDLIIAGDIGFYHYAFNNSGLYFISSIGKRFYKTRPYYFEMGLSLGILRTFYDGTVYTVDDYGNVKEENDFGRFYAVTGLFFGFGHDFERSNKPKPFAIEIKPSLWLQYPYNSYALLHLSVAIGFKYHFDRFNICIKQKQTTRHLDK